MSDDGPSRPPRTGTGARPRFDLFRDAWGVPHVRASSELDVSYGQGYAAGLDRGWQVLVARWRVEGRFAARFGPAGLEWDRFAVRVRLRDTAVRVFDALAPDDRAWVTAHAAGVRAGLAAGGGEAPELGALAAALDGAPLPDDTASGGRLWPDWMPVGVFLLNHVLFSGFPHLFWREHVRRTLGDDARTLGLLDADGGPSSGSNAWALHGSRTASGLPLLAGDPHRLLELPGVYQQVRLASTGSAVGALDGADDGADDGAFDVLGLAFPGVPGVLHLGHATSPAGSAAWGITNALAHHVEVFTEALDGGARGPGALAAAEITASGSETVPVRGGEPVTVGWAETSRGPMVTDRHSLRWPVRETADAGVGAWRRLQRVRSATDVADAFAGWVDPVNRVLAADSGGEVLSFTAGRVPDVPRSGRVVPRQVVDGQVMDDGVTHGAVTRDAGWRTLPAPERVHDVAVDANERPVRPELDLGLVYAEHRADRVRVLLADEPAGATAAGQERVLGDTQDAGAAALVSWLDGCADPRADRLRTWAAGGAPMDADSADAALFARWRDTLVRRVAAHPALAPLHAPHGLPEIFEPWLDVTVRVGDALPRLLAGHLAGPLAGHGPGHRIDGRAEAAAALADVAPDDGSGDDSGRVTWGDLHRLYPLHALAEIPGLEPPPVPPAPLSGAGDTVRCTGGVPGVTSTASRGSVARWVWDLSDRQRSRWGVPFGADGDPRSEHFADQHGAWAEARTVEIETEWALLRPETVLEDR